MVSFSPINFAATQLFVWCFVLKINLLKITFENIIGTFSLIGTYRLISEDVWTPAYSLGKSPTVHLIGGFFCIKSALFYRQLSFFCFYLQPWGGHKLVLYLFSCTNYWSLVLVLYCSPDWKTFMYTMYNPENKMCVSDMNPLIWKNHFIQGSNWLHHVLNYVFLDNLCKLSCFYYFCSCPVDCIMFVVVTGLVIRDISNFIQWVWLNHFKLQKHLLTGHKDNKGNLS